MPSLYDKLFQLMSPHRESKGSHIQHFMHDKLFQLMPPHRKGLEEAELVYASEANLEIPQMVIKFYESKLTWHEAADESESTH